MKVSNYDPDIQISTCGLVWRIKRGDLYRIQPYNNKGVLYVDLYNNGGQKRLAELVLTTFNKPGNGWIDYLDGDKSNCRLNNLKWRSE